MISKAHDDSYHRGLLILFLIIDCLRNVQSIVSSSFSFVYFLNFNNKVRV